MRPILTLSLSCLLVLAGCSKSGETPTAAVPADRQDLSTSATEFVTMLAKEDFAGAVARFDAAMKNALPEPKLRETWHSILGQAGPFKKILGTRTMQQAGSEIVFVTCEFERAILDAKVVFNAARQVTGLWFAPGHRPAPDASASAVPPKTVRETEFKVGDDKWALPGTLTLPATGAGPWPAVGLGLVLLLALLIRERLNTYKTDPYKDIER